MSSCLRQANCARMVMAAFGFLCLLIIVATGAYLFKEPASKYRRHVFALQMISVATCGGSFLSCIQFRQNDTFNNNQVDDGGGREELGSHRGRNSALSSGFNYQVNHELGHRSSEQTQQREGPIARLHAKIWQAKDRLFNWRHQTSGRTQNDGPYNYPTASARSIGSTLGDRQISRDSSFSTVPDAVPLEPLDFLGGTFRPGTSRDISYPREVSADIADEQGWRVDFGSPFRMPFDELDIAVWRGEHKDDEATARDSDNIGVAL